MLVVHGLRADERHGVQPVGRPRRRREEPAHPRAARPGRHRPRRRGARARRRRRALAFLAVAATPRLLARASSRPACSLVLLGYSYAKRFTWGAHAWLGVALALAPGGAWLAMGARPGAGHRAAHGRRGDVAARVRRPLLAARRGLRPRGGASLDPRALRERARARHHAPAPTWSRSCRSPGADSCSAAGRLYAVAVAVAAALLVYEHSLVRRRGLAAIDKAFFDVNAWVSVALLRPRRRRRDSSAAADPGLLHDHRTRFGTKARSSRQRGEPPSRRVAKTLATSSVATGGSFVRFGEPRAERCDVLVVVLVAERRIVAGGAVAVRVAQAVEGRAEDAASPAALLRVDHRWGQSALSTASSTQPE